MDVQVTVGPDEDTESVKRFLRDLTRECTNFLHEPDQIYIVLNLKLLVHTNNIDAVIIGHQAGVLGWGLDEITCSSPDHVAFNAHLDLSEVPF